MRAASDDKTLKDQVTVSFLAFSKNCTHDFRKEKSKFTFGWIDLFAPATIHRGLCRGIVN